MNLFVGASTKKQIEWKVQKVERKETRAEVCGNRHRALSRQSWVQEHTDDGVRSLLRSCCSTNHPRRGYILMYLGSSSAPFTCFYSCLFMLADIHYQSKVCTLIFLLLAINFFFF